MTREILLQRTIESLSKIPDQKMREVSEFAEFLLHKMEDRIITDGIQNLTVESNSYKFLLEEEIYTVNDLKEVYKWRKVILY